MRVPCAYSYGALVLGTCACSRTVYYSVTELLDVCDLVACNAQTLLDALTSRTVNAMKEAVKTDLSTTEVRKTRMSQTL